MRMLVSYVALVALPVGLAFNTAAAQAARPKPSAATKAVDEAAIRHLLDVYTESIDKADTTMGATIWKTTPDVSFIDPRGHSVGWKQVKESFYLGTMGKTFSERRLRVQPQGLAIHVLASGDAAWAEFNWDFTAKFRHNGQQMNSAGRESQVYEKTPQGWRIVHVHYSGMPMTGVGQGF